VSANGILLEGQAHSDIHMDTDVGYDSIRVRGVRKMIVNRESARVSRGACMLLRHAACAPRKCEN